MIAVYAVKRDALRLFPRLDLHLPFEQNPSLDIVPFLQIIKSTGEPIKATIEESRLVEAVRDVQRKR